MGTVGLTGGLRARNWEKKEQREGEGEVQKGEREGQLDLKLSIGL